MMARRLPARVLDLRACFERVLQVVPPAQADYIWQRYLDFELHYGDLESLARLEKRRAEQLGDGACVTHS